MKNEIAWEKFLNLNEINPFLQKNNIKATDVINISYNSNDYIVLFYIKRPNTLDV